MFMQLAALMVLAIWYTTDMFRSGPVHDFYEEIYKYLGFKFFHLTVFWLFIMEVYVKKKDDVLQDISILDNQTKVSCFQEVKYKN